MVIPSRISARWGRPYIDSTRPRTGRTPRFVDKLPRNDRWAALIRLALPRARFILTRRDPMDSCYAMFRTLFRAGYHFTYDLETLGHYYLAHQRMISALKKTLPSDALLEMAYEDLVADPEARARELVDFCGPRLAAGLSRLPSQQGGRRDRQCPPGAAAGVRHLGGKMAPCRAIVAPAGKDSGARFCMTIISHRHRFIFLKSRKTAGTSIEQAPAAGAGRRRSGGHIHGK